MTVLREPQQPSAHIADSHEMIRVVGARENNLKGVERRDPEAPAHGLHRRERVGQVLARLRHDRQRVAAPHQRDLPDLRPAVHGAAEPARRRRARERQPGDHRRPGAHGRQRRAPRSAPRPTRTRCCASSSAASASRTSARRRRSRSTSPRCPGAGAVTFEKGGKKVKERRSFEITGGMCPRCEGLGEASDIDLDELYRQLEVARRRRASRSPATTSTAGWCAVSPSRASSTRTSRSRTTPSRSVQDFLYKEPTKVKIQNINMTYEGLIPKVTKSMLQKDRDSLQPHIRAFVDRAVKFTACPDCHGTRLNEGARSSKIKGVSIADAAPCRSRISPTGSPRSTTPRSPRSCRACARRSTRSSTSGSATSRSTGRRARCRAARRSAPR